MQNPSKGNANAEQVATRLESLKQRLGNVPEARTLQSEIDAIAADIRKLGKEESR